MYKINAFLQKKKKQEGNHGFGMVIIAYVLSIVMLFVGSDSFYQISTSAADGMFSDEEMKSQEIDKGLYMSAIRQQPKLLYSDLINPYGLDDMIKEDTSGIQILSTKKIVQENSSTDTYWLLGYEINVSEYDHMLNQIINDITLKEKKVVKSTKTKGKEVTATQTTKNKYIVKISVDEIDMLERIVEAEAGGEGLKGKVLVANVVINRVKNNHFPNTIEGVICQEQDGEYQFSPLKDKRFWSVKVSKETIKAVKMALKGEDYSKGALYFIAKNRASKKNSEWFEDSLQWLFKYGGHEFYKNK